MEVAQFLIESPILANSWPARYINSVDWPVYPIGLIDCHGAGILIPQGGGNIAFKIQHDTPFLASGAGAAPPNSGSYVNVTQARSSLNPRYIGFAIDPSEGTGSYSIVSSQSLKLNTSAATASGTTLTFASTTGLTAIGAVGLPVTGTNIPAGTTVSSFTGTTITLSAAVTGGGVASGATITIGYGSPASVGVVTDDVTINHKGFDPSSWDANTPVQVYWSKAANVWSRA
jgi:hypothetical protein